MRTLALILAAALALTAAPAVAASELEVQLALIAATHHGKVGLYATNLKTGAVVGLDPDEPVPTASVIKLTVLFHAMREIRAGRARLDEPLTLTKSNQVAGSGVLGMLDAPKTITLKDALTLMIALSDNTATNMVIDRFGLAQINATTRAIGLKDTYLYKKVYMPPPADVPADQPRFGLGKTTPREMAQVMRRIVRCELSEKPSTPDENDRAVCSAALAMLRAQFYRDGIPRYLETLDSSDTGSAIAEKTGAVDAARTDVAAIATAEGTLVLSIFTHDNKDQSWTADDEPDLTMAKLARAIVKAWAPKGPDAKAGF